MACRADLEAHQKLEVMVTVPPGMVRSFRAEQMAGTIHILRAEPPLEFTNPAGLHSAIRILLGGAAPGNPALTLENPSAQPAQVAITVGAGQPADAGTAREQDAETELATAEALRARKGSSRTEALAAYDQAIADWKALDDPADEARALSWKAIFLYLHENDATAALPVIAQATALAGSENVAEAANTWKGAGFLNAALTHYDAARDAYGKALAGFTKTGDLFNQALLLDNLSRLERMEGHETAALQDATQAANLAERTGDLRRQLGIEEEIGAIHTVAGDLEPAYDAYERALVLLQKAPDPVMEGYVWSDMGVLYTMLGDDARAHDALDHAAGVWARNPNPFGAMNTLDDTGDLLLAEGKPEAAREFYTRGLGLAEKSTAERYSVYFLRGIGDSYLFQNDGANAERNLRLALDLGLKVKEGDGTAHIYCSLGDLELQRQDFAAARHQYEQCAAGAAAMQDPVLKIRAAGGLARAAYEEGDLDDAEAQSESALGGIELLRGSLGGMGLKTTYFASMHAYYDLDIQILARLDRAHPGAGYRWKAFLAAERGRARTLLDEVEASDAGRLTGAASPLRAEYDDVLRRLRAAESQSGQHSEGGGAQATLARLNLEEHALHEEIAAADRAGTETDQTPPLTLAGIQAALPDRHSALIEYWTGQNASYAWAISRAGIRMMRLPPAAQLDREIGGLRQAVLAEINLSAEMPVTQREAALEAARRNTQRGALTLAQTLFPAGLLPMGASTLLVVGDGPTLAVPFAALPIRPGGVTVLSEPSAAIFSFLEAHPIAPRPLRIAVFVNGGSSQESPLANHVEKAALTRGSADELPTLSFAAAEAAMIRGIFHSTRIFTGSSAAPQAIGALDWDAYSVGHFAMHAVLNAHYAELNGLVTDASSEGSAGGHMLWYGDVCRLHARLDLVVLSACDTALGERIPGEGLLGLTQAFFAAGSQRVLGTLWPVDDEATAAWMRDFYTALKTTRSPAKALVAAQRAMAATSEWKSPFYWAGFTLAGDWRPLP